jgi:DNA helicase-2/ATP-dependent DNA helicase PcrA
MTSGDQNSSLLARLTPSQREAVLADDPRLAVYAGAGAGKTRVLTLRAARLVEEGADPSHVLVVTFSRKASQELRNRLWRLGVQDVRAGTFHRTALDLMEIRRAELGQGPPRLLADRRGALERVGDALPNLRTSGAGGALDTEVTWAKANLLGPEDYVEAARVTRRRTRLAPEVIGEVYQNYELHKSRQGMVDFDDLIIEATDALADPTFAQAVNWRTRHVLIDEFQDVNAAQFEFVRRLLGPSATFFCVGDPNQSIYGFNGSDPNLLRQLEVHLPGTRLISLNANHRSTPEIVLSAQCVLPPADVRPLEATQRSGAAPLLYAAADDEDEAQFVARTAWSTRGPGGHWRSIAVLARTNAQLGAIETALKASGIPSVRLAPDLARASDVTPHRTARPGTAVQREEDAVVLGTFHRAKGLEWPTVFVIGVSDGFVPHVGATSAAATDEERRLLYVAMTRAERTLVVSWASRSTSEENRRAPTRRRSPFLEPFERHLATLDTQQPALIAEKGARRASKLRRQLAERLGQPLEDSPED